MFASDSDSGYERGGEGQTGEQWSDRRIVANITRESLTRAIKVLSKQRNIFIQNKQNIVKKLKSYFRISLSFKIKIISFFGPTLSVDVMHCCQMFQNGTTFSCVVYTLAHSYLSMRSLYIFAFVS